MPELPEVEVTRRNLVRWFARRKLVGVEVDRTRITRGGDPEALGALRGKLTHADRRGKFLLLRFGERARTARGLLAHLGMTGRFVHRASAAPERFSRARFLLDNGAVLHFTDPRMFGQLIALPAEALEAHPSVAQLGVDPLVEGLSGETLAAALSGSRQALKVALMDQRRVAGLGNIHAAEALFRAGLHPALSPGRLKVAAYARLAEAIHAAFAFGLERAAAEEIRYLRDRPVEGEKLENPFFVYDRAGSPCLRCQTPVRSITQGGRTTHFCPTCQSKTRKHP